MWKYFNTYILAVGKNIMLLNASRRMKVVLRKTCKFCGKLIKP